MFLKRIRSKQNLSNIYGNKGIIVTLMLIVSLLCNILALFTPFSNMGNLFSKTLYVSLPYSVYLMWIESFYAIAILIFGFSILFPFIKLYYLFYIWLFEEKSNKRHSLLKTIEPLGKWSMLDVFATCIIIILCNKQILIYGTPMIGVNFFLVAIFLSILSSIIIDYCQDKSSDSLCSEELYITSQHSMYSTFWFRLSAVIILLISFIILILAIFYPYLKITSLLLIGYSYSIFTSVTSLSNISIVLSLFLLFTMIIFPILHTGSMLFYWILKLLNNKPKPNLSRTIKIFSRFNMLDVFLLAFVIFLFEGKSKIQIDHRSGLLLIAFFIFLILIIPQILLITRKFIRYKKKHRKY